MCISPHGNMWLWVMHVHECHVSRSSWTWRSHWYHNCHWSRLLKPSLLLANICYTGIVGFHKITSKFLSVLKAWIRSPCLYRKWLFTHRHFQSLKVLFVSLSFVKMVNILKCVCWTFELFGKLHCQVYVHFRLIVWGVILIFCWFWCSMFALLQVLHILVEQEQFFPWCRVPVCWLTGKESMEEQESQRIESYDKIWENE